MTLTARASLGAVFVVVVAVLMVGVTFARSQERAVRSRIDESMALEVERVGAAMQLADIGGVPTADACAQLQGSGISVIEVFSDRKSCRSREVPASAITVRSRGGALRGDRRAIRTASTDGVEVRELVAPLPGYSKLGVRVLRPVDDLSALQQRSWRLLAGTTLLVGLASAWLAWLVTRSALRPLHRLEALISRITRTRDLAARTGVSSRDEVGHISASFDEMVAALQQAEHRQRQLVADTAHELRTPLTSLRANMELLGQADCLPLPDRADLVEDLERQVEDVASLVDDLVDLARDEPLPEAQRAPVRLGELARARVERARRQFPGRDIRIDAGQRDVWIDGSEHRLARAIDNLVVNACKYGADPIEVVVDPLGIEVVDYGAGVPDEELLHVFDRFYRATSAGTSAGSGLGLAIVRSTALAHGGTVEASRIEPYGLRLRVRLPVTTDTITGNS